MIELSIIMLNAPTFIGITHTSLRSIKNGLKLIKGKELKNNIYTKHKEKLAQMYNINHLKAKKVRQMYNIVSLIAKERIQAVKDKDLVNVCERLGIELQKNGRNYVAICPFHIENKSKFHN